MRHPLSRISAVIARIALLLFVFGLLSQAAQACLLSKQAVAGTGIATTEGSPCQVTGKHAVAHAKCALNDVHADVCFAQASVTASHESFPSTPAPVAIAVAPKLVSLVKPLQTVVLAVPPHPTPRSRLPLSILHCSFQI